MGLVNSPGELVAATVIATAAMWGTIKVLRWLDAPHEPPPDANTLAHRARHNLYEAARAVKLLEREAAAERTLEHEARELAAKLFGEDCARAFGAPVEAPVPASATSPA